MRFPVLMPDEHLYSCLIRARFLNAEMHINERAFFALHDLPFHLIRSQTPLCSHLNAVINLMELDPRKQFILRLKHTPFAPWLLSLPDDMNALELKLSGHRNNLEENRYTVDKRWKFCPVCSKEERKKIGFSYWHSSHQLLGARRCLRHQVALHSHKELRYLRFSLPHHWIDKSEPINCTAWQIEWQNFIYALAKRIQTAPNEAQKLVLEVKELLQLNRKIKRSDKPYFDKMSDEMVLDLGKTCLNGLFVDYLKDNPRKTNIPWVVFSGFSQAKSIRHPLYYLTILFWLREKLRIVSV